MNKIISTSTHERIHILLNTAAQYRISAQYVALLRTLSAICTEIISITGDLEWAQRIEEKIKALEVLLQDQRSGNDPRSAMIKGSKATEIINLVSLKLYETGVTGGQNKHGGIGHGNKVR